MAFFGKYVKWNISLGKYVHFCNEIWMFLGFSIEHNESQL